MQLQNYEKTIDHNTSNVDHILTTNVHDAPYVIVDIHKQRFELFDGDNDGNQSYIFLVLQS